MNFHQGILIDKIPAEGMGGFLFALGTALIFLIGIPAIRPLGLIGLAGGLFFAGILYFWHNQTRW